MFRNYLAAALRNLARNRLYASIAIAGLAVGLAAALLIALYIRAELSWDRFLPDHARTFLVTETYERPGLKPLETDATRQDIAGRMRLAFSEVEAAARLANSRNGVRRGDVEAAERIYWADPELFAVLALPVLAG